MKAVFYWYGTFCVGATSLVIAAWLCVRVKRAVGPLLESCELLVRLVDRVRYDRDRRAHIAACQARERHLAVLAREYGEFGADLVRIRALPETVNYE